MKKNLISFATLSIVGLTGTSNSLNAQNLKKPNIIIILADDLGWGDVGYHGSKIKTPNIDAMAEEGVILSRFYVAPISSPTRAGLLTGMYPDRFGIRENVIPPWRDFGLDSSNLVIPKFLEMHGYKNRAIIGKWHLGHSRRQYHPMNHGFSHYYGHLNGAIDYFTHEREGELDWHNNYKPSYDEGYSTNLLSEEAVRCIKEYNNDNSPFFLYVGFNAPHTPFQAKEEDIKLYTSDFQHDKVNSDNVMEKQIYAAMVTSMDEGIGNILRTLKELDIDDNTLVLFFSDNGADEVAGGGSSGPLRGHKAQEFEGGVLVPSVIQWPERFEGKRVVDQLTGFVDIFPTILEIVDPQEKTKKLFDGISILKVLEKKQDNIHRTFYLGRGALIENDWKIILANKNPQIKTSHDLLFNLKIDPYEENNVSKKYPFIKSRLVDLVNSYDSIKSKKVLPPYNKGRKGFKPPKEWNIFQ